MKKCFAIWLIPVLLLPAMQLTAAEDNSAIEHQLMLEEAERARREAQVAREGAMKAAQMARETARMNAEITREAARREAGSARESSEQRRQKSEQLARERALQNEELARTREELSRTHRELREATREVARAHREIARTGNGHVTSHRVNLGDRAVIGVVLGEQTGQGVELIGVSPDGPAERAGLEQGDVLVTIGDTTLEGNEHARQSLFEIMGEVEDGEELAVTVDRDGEILEYTVIAEKREPLGWQSVIRIPEVEVVEGIPGEKHIIVERIEVPEIDEEAIAAQVAELSERLEAGKFAYRAANEDYEHHFKYDINVDDFSDFGAHAMREANIWFGLPHAHGLELAAVNEGLGAYFKTERGVLVIQAKEDNAYQLQSGDVILEVDSTTVNSPSDLMRALRDVDPGSEIDIWIKRQERDVTLSVVMPENRLGFR